MALRVQCPNGCVMRVPSNRAGMSARCPGCKAVVVIPFPPVDHQPSTLLEAVLSSSATDQRSSEKPVEEKPRSEKTRSEKTRSEKTRSEKTRSEKPPSEKLATDPSDLASIPSTPSATSSQSESPVPAIDLKALDASFASDSISFPSTGPDPLATGSPTPTDQPKPTKSHEKPRQPKPKMASDNKRKKPKRSKRTITAKEKVPNSEPLTQPASLPGPELPAAKPQPDAPSLKIPSAKPAPEKEVASKPTEKPLSTPAPVLNTSKKQDPQPQWEPVSFDTDRPVSGPSDVGEIVIQDQSPQQVNEVPQIGELGVKVAAESRPFRLGKSSDSPTAPGEPQPSTSSAIERRTLRANADRITLTRFFAAMLVFVGIVNFTPAIYCWYTWSQNNIDFLLPRWIYLQIFIAVLHVVYAVLLLQVPDWSTLRSIAVVMLVFAFVFGLFSMGLLTTGDGGMLAQFLQVPGSLGRQACIWCVAMLCLATLASYLAGRESSAWQRTEKLLAEILAKKEAA